MTVEYQNFVNIHFAKFNTPQNFSPANVSSLQKTPPIQIRRLKVEKLF